MKRILLCLIMVQGIFILNRQSLHSRYAEDILWEEIPVVLSVSKRTQPVIEAPASSYIITAEDIEKRGYTNLKDIFRDLPGMESIEYYFSELGTEVPVRGITGNNKIIFMINGMRVNPPGGEGMPLRSDFNITNARQVEIGYGPGSTLYGQDAISAIVNVVTEEEQEGLEAGIEGGLNNHQAAYISGVKHFEDFTASGNISFTDRELIDLKDQYQDWWAQYTPAQNYDPEKKSPERWDRGLNAFLKLNSDYINLQLWYRDSSRSSAEGGFPNTLYYAEEAEWKDSSLVAEAGNKYEISDRVRLNSALTFNKYEIDPASRYVWKGGDGSLYYKDNKYGSGRGVSLEEELSIDLLDNLFIFAGMEASFYNVIPKCTVPGGADTDENIIDQAGHFNYWITSDTTTSAKTIPGATKLSYSDYGYYLEGDWEISDNFDFIAGARIDTSSRYDEMPFSPRLALIHKPGRNLSFKYMFKQAFVAPAPYYSYSTFDNSEALNTVNEELEPETASTSEIEINYRKQNLTLNASLYYSQQENLLILGDEAREPNIVEDMVWVVDGSTRVLTQSANSGKSNSMGFDLWSRFNIGSHSLWGSYSYVDYTAKHKGGDEGLPGISRHNIRLGSTLNLTEDFLMTNSLVWRSKPENLNASGLTGLIESPYEINTYMNYRINQNWKIFADIRNITNNKYALRGVKGLAPQETFRGHLGVKYTM